MLRTFNTLKSLSESRQGHREASLRMSPINKRRREVKRPDGPQSLRTTYIDGTIGFEKKSDKVSDL